MHLIAYSLDYCKLVTFGQDDHNLETNLLLFKESERMCLYKQHI